MRTIAILCGGGPAPGINTVVATVTKVFLKDGFRVLAIHEGYKGLFAVHPEVEELTYEKADQIYSRGGSAIKMSRFKPEDQDFTTALFVKEGIELLVTIGGDDTASTANRLTKYLAAHQVNIRNIHVPKTIDNDRSPRRMAALAALRLAVSSEGYMRTAVSNTSVNSSVPGSYCRATR